MFISTYPCLVNDVYYDTELTTMPSNSNVGNPTHLHEAGEVWQNLARTE